MRSRKDKWVRGAILVIGTIVFLLFALVPWWSRRILKQGVRQDREGASPQHSVATLVTLVGPGNSELGNPTSAQAIVRFRGKLCPVGAVVDFDKLRPNQPAQILYRIGKSGRIYVDTVAPLPTSASNRRESPSE